jgi:hypothetical protein
VFVPCAVALRPSVAFVGADCRSHQGLNGRNYRTTSHVIALMHRTMACSGAVVGNVDYQSGGPARFNSCTFWEDVPRFALGPVGSIRKTLA